MIGILKVSNYEELYAINLKQNLSQPDLVTAQAFTCTSSSGLKCFDTARFPTVSWLQSGHQRPFEIFRNSVKIWSGLTFRKSLRELIKPSYRHGFTCLGVNVQKICLLVMSALGPKSNEVVKMVALKTNLQFALLSLINIII